MSIDDLIVIPSKKVIELITVEYDLLEQLPSGVTIAEVVVSNTVFQGFTDIAAGSMLYLAPVIHGSLIQQKIRNGIAGNTYNLLFTITLSNSWVLQKTFRLSITPNNTPAVPISIPLYFTSQPYPIELFDSMGSESVMLSGGFLFSPSPKDYMASGSVMVSGSLADIVRIYSYGHENMMAGSVMQSGIITVLVKTYDDKFDSVRSASVMRSGVLARILVTYNIPHENISSAAVMRSGTLV